MTIALPTCNRQDATRMAAKENQNRATLIPLVAEIGGRWHPSVPQLVRRLAKGATLRQGRDDDHFAAMLTSRWSARLSALLIRGNGAVLCAARCKQAPPRRPWDASTSALPHSLPEGDCLYELACVRCYASDEEA